MKFFLVTVTLLSIGLIYSQGYKGKGDIKTQVGLNVQNGGTGLSVSTDFGLNKTFSIGLAATYLVSAKDGKIDETAFLIGNPSYDPIIDGTINLVTEPKTKDKIDVRARFNASLNNALKLGSKMDIYPGLDVGLKNFGAHFGLRYFFSNNFGIFAESGIPIVKFDKDDNRVSEEYYDYYLPNYNNQFLLNIGISFNL